MHSLHVYKGTPLHGGACRILPSPGFLDADAVDARVVVSHTASPEDPEIWLPPSRQPSVTRAQAASDDESFKQALRRPSSSEGGERQCTKRPLTDVLEGLDRCRGL